MKLSGKVVFASGRSVDFDIWSLSLDNGELRQLTSGMNFNVFPKWSPDGRRIAYVCTEDDMIPSLWVMDEDGRNKRRLTTDIYVQSPSWAPDGKRLLFTANAGNREELEVCTLSLDEGSPEPLFKRSGIEEDPRWSPDGKKVLFSAPAKEGDQRVAGLDTAIIEYDISTGAFKTLASNPSRDYGAVYSPDGSRIAFVSHRNEIDEARFNAAVQELRETIMNGNNAEARRAIREINALEEDGDIFVMDCNGENLRQVTRNSYADKSVCWSPCGTYLMYTSTSMRHHETERLRVVRADDGSPVSFNYDRTRLNRELGAEQLLDRTIFQKLIPNFIERKLVEPSFWGEERQPDWHG